MGIRAGLNMFIYRNSTPETINIIETIAKKQKWIPNYVKILKNLMNELLV